MLEIKKSLEEISLENYIFNKVRKEIASWINNSDKDDIYVISFLIHHDDEYFPTLIVDYNTTYNFMEQRNNHNVLELEAKWNYAFWLQYDSLVLFEQADSDEMEFRNEFFKACFFRDNYNSKLEKELLFEELIKEKDFFTWLDEDPEILMQKFLEVCINVSNRIHQDGIIAKIFKKELPIIIHELIFNQDTLDWNIKANLNNEALEFITDWKLW